MENAFINASIPCVAGDYFLVLQRSQQATLPRHIIDSRAYILHNTMLLLGAGFGQPLSNMKVIGLVLGFCLWAVAGFGQCVPMTNARPGDIDTCFNFGGNGFYIRTYYGATIYSLALQPDRKIIATGNFSEYNGISKTGIIRLHPSGKLDTSFKADWRYWGHTFKAHLLGSGKILVGGDFSELLRLLPNGKRDTTFSNRQLSDGWVTKIFVRPNNKIIVNGTFTKYNGVRCRGIAQLNSDGTLDRTLK